MQNILAGESRIVLPCALNTAFLRERRENQVRIPSSEIRRGVREIGRVLFNRFGARPGPPGGMAMECAANLRGLPVPVSQAILVSWLN